MRKIWPAKDPDESLRYGFNWSPRNIGVDTILTIDVTVVSGTVVHVASEVANVPNARTGQGTIHRFSGGTAGEMNEILLQITTSGGDTLQETVCLPIRNK